VKMVNPTALRTDFNNIVNENGVICRIRYFNPVFTSGTYDDDIDLFVSGDTWTSGLRQPMDKAYGGKEAVLLEQGLVSINDSKLYIQGSIDMSGTLKIMIGSPTGDNYQVINDAGVIEWNINETPIYKKVYIRRLETGSFYGE